MKTANTLATKTSKIVLAAALALSCFGITSLTTLTSAHQTRDQAFADYGWYYDKGDWYYHEGYEGAIGWRHINGTWYYFNEKYGRMVTNWQYISGHWYYFDDNGAMVTGWYAPKMKGNWYYFNSSGTMITGWRKIGSAWYFFNKSGAMQIGWQKIGGMWYHFNGSGAMDTNKWVGNYYVKGSGVMATNERIGKYHVNANGLWDGASTNSDPLHIVTDWYEFRLPASWKSKVSYTNSGNSTTVYLAGHKDYELFTIKVTAAPDYYASDVGVAEDFIGRTTKGAYVNLILYDWVEGACVPVRFPHLYGSDAERDKIYSQLVELQTGGSITLEQIKNDLSSIDDNAADEYMQNTIISTLIIRER